MSGEVDGQASLRPGSVSPQMPAQAEAEREAFDQGFSQPIRAP